MKNLLLLTALTLTSCAELQTKDNRLDLTAGGFSKHFTEKKTGKWNEKHDNIGLEYSYKYSRNWRAFTGYERFRNSFGKQGSLTTAGAKYCFNGSICVPLGVGYFTGYKDTTFSPYTGLEIGFGKVTLRAVIAPPKLEQGERSGFGFVGLRYKLMEW